MPVVMLVEREGLKVEPATAKTVFQPGDKLMRKLNQATFEPTISRKAQAAALRAEKEGKKNADWDDSDEGESGGE